MQRYPRKPAVIIVLIATFLGVGYVVAQGRIERYWKGRNGGDTIEALEKTIAAGKATPGTWFTYGDALADAGQQSRAADAFKQAVVMDPANRDAKFRLGRALAQAGRGDELYKVLQDLVYGEAKVAVQLFERPEVAKYLGEERFANLSKEASGQAMD